jgi:integrase
MSITTDGNGRHTIEFQLRGRRIHQRLPAGVTRAEAEARQAKLKHDIFAARDLGVKPTVPLPAAIQLWLEEKVTHDKAAKQTRSHARALVSFVVGKSVADIPDVADRYRTRAKADGLAAATINRRLAVLKGVARFAYNKKWIGENQSSRVWSLRENNARHVYLTAADLAKVVKQAETIECRAWITLAAYTGLRKSELYGLGKPGGGIVKGGLIWLPDTKTNEPRPVPVTKRATWALKHVPFERTLPSLDWEWMQTRKAAGFPHVHFHDLRHTTASLLANAGVPLEVVGVILGHTCTQTTKRYTHLYLKTITQAMARL